MFMWFLLKFLMVVVCMQIVLMILVLMVAYVGTK